MITIAMGEIGKISRLAGGIFGSDVTFAAGRESSAPGQMAFADLKTAMAMLYGE
jgi:3-dehydroquinate dehydratase-1